MSVQELENVLQMNLNPQSNEMRAQAEKQLMELKANNPMLFYAGLGDVMTKSNDAGVRAFAAVIFRRNTRIMDDTFDNVPAQARQQVSNTLLNGIMHETDRSVRIKLADVIGSLACRILPRGPWPELQNALLQLAQGDPQGREVFLIALDHVAEFAPDILRERMADVREAIVQSLQDEFPPVRVAAMKACTSMLRTVDSMDDLGSLNDIVPIMFKCLSAGGNDMVVASHCEQLGGLVDRRTELFDNNFAPIMQCLLELVKSSGLSWGTRRQAMDLCVTMIENCTKYEPGPVAREVIPLAFAFMDEFDQSLEWNSPADDNEQDNFVFGGQCLTRLVEMFGEEGFLSVTQPILERSFSSSEWKPRLVALGAVKHVVDFCAQSWSDTLDSIVQVSGSSLASDHPYVRYMALSVLQQLCVVFGSDEDEEESAFHIKYHKAIVAACVKMMQEERHRCVLSQTCELVTHFCFDCPVELLGSFAQILLEKLHMLLQRDDPLIQSSACKSVSVIAACCAENFSPYYETFINAGKALLSAPVVANAKGEVYELRGKTMEMIGYVIVACPEKSQQDGHQVMRQMIPQTANEKQLGLISYNYMMRLYSTICRVLKADFCQYLDHIIPPLLESAKVQVAGHFEADDPAAPPENAANIISTTIHVSILGNKKICVNTDAMEEKKCAVEQLGVYAEQLEGNFFPYVEPVFVALKECCTQKGTFSHTRAAALEAMPHLVHCYVDGVNKRGGNGKQQCREMCLTVMALLIDSVSLEEDVEGMVNTFRSLCEIMEETEQPLPEELVGDLTEQITAGLTDRQIRHHQEDSAESMEVDSVTEDAERAFADQVTDLVRNVAKYGQEAFIQHFDNTVSKLCVELLGQQSTVEDRILGLGIFTEVVDNGGPAAQKYGQDLLNVCQMYLVDSDAGLRQQSAFTVGVCAKANVMVNTEGFLGMLKQLVDDPHARHEDNVGVTENCISAIGKICRYHGDKCDVSGIFPAWLQMLPIQEDSEERESCNDYLLEQLQGSFKDVVLSNEKVLVQVLKIIGDAIVNEDSHTSQFGQFFSFVAQQNKPLVQKCFESGLLEQKTIAALTGNGTCA